MRSLGNGLVGLSMFAGVVGLLAACSSDDVPGVVTSIDVKYASLGMPTPITTSARRCIEGGGLRLACRSWEDVPVKIVSLQCTPEDACTQIRFSGAGGFLTPLIEQPNITAVIECEAERHTLLHRPTAPYALPAYELALAAHWESGLDELSGGGDDPAIAFAGSPVWMKARSSADDIEAATGEQLPFERRRPGESLELVATLDGQPLAVSRASNTGANSMVLPTHAGTITVTAFLKRPRRELGQESVVVHDPSAVTAATFVDTACVGPALHAARVDGDPGGWTVSFALVGSIGAARGILNPSSAVLEGVAGSVSSVDGAGRALLKEAPGPNAAMTFTVAGTSFRTPITTDACTAKSNK